MVINSNSSLETMKQSVLLAMTLTLVTCQIAKTEYQVAQVTPNQNKTQDENLDEYQEEAYLIGKQEESYQQKKTSLSIDFTSVIDGSLPS